MIDKRQTLWYGAVGLVVLAAIGCGQQPDYAFRHLEFKRYGWDSLSVEVEFSEQLLFGRTRPIEAQAVAVYLFNARYDTLYTGDGRLVPIDDRALGDRERLMLEVCGRFETATVCEQQAVTASPKRLQVEHDIEYPDGGTYDKGRYQLRFVLERQGQDEAWERLARPDRVQGYLRVYVGDQEEEAVEVPFSARRGRFNLQGKPHYDDFHYHLTSTLLDTSEARVHFDIYAGLEGLPVSNVASVEKKVRGRTDEERVLEVDYFVEQATEAIFEALDIDDIDDFERPDSTEWAYNRLTDTYRINVEVFWRMRRRRPFSRPRSYGFEGVLEVEASGANARFLRRAATERTLRRWAVTIGDATISLGTLTPYVHEEDEGEE